MRFVRGTRWGRLISVSVAVLLGLIALVWLVVPIAPPGSLTRTRFVQAHRRIADFATRTGQLPTTLIEVAGDLRDEWGRPIEMTITVSGEGTLFSAGRDGRPGGTGADADIVGTFSLRRVGEHWDLGPPMDFVVAPC